MTGVAVLTLTMLVSLQPAAAQEDKPAAAPEAVDAVVSEEPAKAAETPVVVPALVAPAGIPPGAEWSFLKSAAEESNAEAAEEAMREAEAFAARRSEDELGVEARLLAATLRQRKGDNEGAAVALLQFIYEYPDSKLVFQAKRAYTELVEKKLSRKLRSPMSELVRPPEGGDKAQRLAALLERLGAQAVDDLYPPALEAFRQFQGRFPEHAGSDRLLIHLAQLHARNSRPGAALHALKRLLALHSGSPLRPQAYWQAGRIYADSLKEYNKAIDAFQELVDRHPQAPEVLPALESAAKLFEERLKSYDLSIEVYERIVKVFPRSEGALKALRAQARLQRERLKRPAEAVKTLRRVADDYRFPAGADALKEAAAIGRKDLNDYGLEVELRRKIASSYPDTAEATEQLYAAAEVLEDDLKDDSQAKAAYQEVVSKYPTHKLAKKASDRIAKIEKRSAP